ncbi:MAG: hypothetical protein ACYDB7_07570 [Mycobacteriales bacterium]
MRLFRLMAANPNLLLELDLAGRVEENPPGDPIERLMMRRKPVLATLLDRLADARTDPRVRGLIVKFGATSMALRRFRSCAMRWLAFEPPASR